MDTVKEYEPLIIDLKKSDPIRSVRGSLTLFLLALLMGIVSVATFLLFSVYKIPWGQSPSLETIDLKMEARSAKMSTKSESTSTTNAGSSKTESGQQMARSPESDVPTQKDSGSKVFDKVPSPRGSLADKPDANGEGKMSESKSNGENASEQTRPDKSSSNVEGKVAESRGNEGGTPERTRSDKPSSNVERKVVESKSNVGESHERVRTDRDRISESKNVGYLTIRTDPDNVLIYINNKLIGVTPLIEFQISAGKHQLKFVYKDNPPAYESITINPSETISISKTLENPNIVPGYTPPIQFQENPNVIPRYTLPPGTFKSPNRVSIDSSSSGADVFINGDYKGQTPLILDDLPSGTYRLTIRKNGFETVTRILEVVEGKPTQQFVTIKRLGLVYPDRRSLPEVGFPDIKALGERRLERPYQ